MIYNYTKCESVIAKIMADLDSSEVQQRTTDIKEWIFEAIDKIGAPMLYISNEITFEILDYQVPLPSGLQVLDGVGYSHSPKGEFVPMVKNTSIFKEPKKHHKEYIPEQPEGHKIITSQSQIYTIQDPKIKKRYDHILDPTPTYFIKPGWLVTNRPKGFVKLAYKTIATDERGYPLIPDLSSYQEAVYWYVVMKLTFPKWMAGKLGGKGVNTGLNIYTFTQQQWNFYRNQAYAEAMMPTADDMEAIRNDWNKLIPEYNSRDTFFENQNRRETIINDYYHGY